MNTKELDKQVDYIGRNGFIKFSNVDSFANLNDELKSFLANTGVYSNKDAVPFLVTSGRLKDIGKGLICFGTNYADYQFCIDINNNNRIVVFDGEDGSVDEVNSSFEKYIGCVYAMRYYVRQFEDKETLGDYSENHEKYALKLHELFNEVEGDITQYSIWYGQVSERELGIL